MAITQITVVLQKNGASFYSEEEANANRFKDFSEVLVRAISANNDMVADGTLAEPMSRSWNEADFTLTLVKLVANLDNYNAIWDPIEVEVQAAETANGWTRVSYTTV